jgi:hypothetical protein
LLFNHLEDKNKPLASRKYAIYALQGIFRNTESIRSDAGAVTALISALWDQDSKIRNSAAYALQCTRVPFAQDVAHGLLQIAKANGDIETRTQVLRSAGRVLFTIRGHRDIEVSKHALFQWLKGISPTKLENIIEKLEGETCFNEIDDAGMVLKSLKQITKLPLSKEDFLQLRGNRQWKELLEKAREEWKKRGNCLKTLPRLPDFIAALESFLAAPDPAVCRAAACGTAWFLNAEEDRPDQLKKKLPDNISILWAMIDAATGNDSWEDEEGYETHHPAAVKQIADWLESQQPREREKLIDAVFKELEAQIIKMEDSQGDEQEDSIETQSKGYEEGWPLRRILIAVLAELSDRLTYRAFTGSRGLDEIISLLAKAAGDPESYTSRRFAVRFLGNLQKFTIDTAAVFFEACRDIGKVYRETLTAVSKFKTFGPGSLDRLTRGLISPSLTV